MSRGRIVVAPKANEPAVRRALVAVAHRRGFSRVLLAEEEADPGVDGVTVYRRRADAIVAPAGSSPATIPLLSVGGPEELGRAIDAGRSHGAVAIRWTAERIIPLENLLAKGHARFETWVVVGGLDEVPAMLGALEHGADHLVVEVSTAEDIDRLEALIEGAGAVSIAWELRPIRRVAPAGLGDRVIVDTTSILRASEGMLVGSAAAFLFHVVSEAVGSKFTRPRPFRVNAGAAHSYVLLADGTTRYLAELEPGDAVAVAEPGGSARSVRVGRIKIERRPLVLVEVEHEGHPFTVFLQDAETVRLSGSAGPVATTQLAVGLTVQGAAFPPARHLGSVVEESIQER